MSETENLLNDYADSLLQGTIRSEDILTSDGELAALLRMAVLIDRVLVQVDPSPEFINQLREELMNEDVITLIKRFRQSTTLQIAAGLGGITFAAGVLWWARRLNEEARLRRREVTPESALAS